MREAKKVAAEEWGGDFRAVWKGVAEAGGVGL